jgi:predicted alpha-1,2-mannosidase
MRRFSLSIAILPLVLLGCQKEAAKEDLTEYVNPFIGTEFTGHTYPAATTPFGLVQAGPDTGIDDWDHCSGYHGADSVILGFSQTHLSGTGCADMCDIMLMPVVGASLDDCSSAFSHSEEVASPGYYGVKLLTKGISVDIAAAPRSAFYRFSYPEGDSSAVVFNMLHGARDRATDYYIHQIDKRTVEGYRRSTGFIKDHHYYFCARFDHDITSSVEEDGKSEFYFGSLGKDTLLMKIGLSTTSQEGAERNLDTEIPHWSFDKVLEESREMWNEYFHRIDVEPRDEGQKVSFYTSLYHALIVPNLVSDVDSSCRYTNYSLWDTYRAEHPFLNIIYPEDNAKFVNTLLDRFTRTRMLSTNEYGECETWCMIGNHAVPVIVDAYLKGVVKDRRDLAEDAIWTSLTTEHMKSYWRILEKYGYYPFDSIKVESVSRTLEHTYDDYCAAEFFKSLGDTAKASFFMKRSDNYKNVFDPSTNLMRGRDSKGEWRTPFNPYRYVTSEVESDYTEGNAWQYSWHVQHDIPGLIGLMGGNDVFIKMLDSLFTMHPGEDLTGVVPDVTGLVGQYAHGNEPSHHVAYLYTMAGRPDKTAEIVRKICDKYYQARPDGLCGNDDCGQMSSWYMFSVMGFYPVDPVSGEYVIGAPQMPSVTLHLQNGKTFTVKAENISDENKYVQNVDLNGKPLKDWTISYDDIFNGGTLHFVMGPSAPAGN